MHIDRSGLMLAAGEFLDAPDDKQAWSLLRKYPQLDLALVQMLAKASSSKENDARYARRLDMLENRSQLEFEELMHGANGAEKMLKDEPSLENLRMLSVLSDAIARHPFLQQFPDNHAALALQSAKYHSMMWRNTFDPGALNSAVERSAEAARLGAEGAILFYTGLLVERYEREGNIEDLDAAIEATAPVLPGDQISDIDLDAAQLATNLANALRHRFDQTGSLPDVARAVKLYQRLVQIPVAEPARRQVRLLNLSAGLSSLYEGSGNLEFLNVSISIATQVFNQAPEQQPQTPQEQPGRSTLANNIGMALQNLYVATSDDAHLRAALAMHLRSVELAPEGSPEVPRNLTNCGSCHVMAYRVLGDCAALDTGIELLRKAITLFNQGAGEGARPLLGLSDALVSRFELKSVREDINDAVSLACRAAGMAEADSALSGYAFAHIAKALVARDNSAFARPEDARTATTSFRESLRIAARNAGIGGVETAISWGAWARSRGSWDEAAEAFGAGLTIHRQLVGRQNSRKTQELRIRRLQGLGAMAAGALIHAGRLEEAVMALESGRGLFLAQKLKRRPEDFNFAEITKRAATSPLVYLENIAGGFALIVREGHVQGLDLPVLREEYVNTWLGEHLDLRLTDPTQFETKLTELCRWLWDAGLGKVAEALGSCEHITLIAGGYLSALPLHASWTEDPSTPTGRRYFMDCVGVRYAPTALSLGEPHRSEWKSVLCIDEPAPTDAPPLPFSQAEARAASGAFETATILRAAEASREATLKALPSCDVVHLSCHGTADLVEPVNSGVLLAGNELLTLADLFELDLTKVDLAMLSACDTAQMGTHLPDEVIGLPSGMLQAGVTSVVSPLWPIDSFGTLLIVARFYEILAGSGVHASEAIRQAQRWMRDTTNAEKAEHFRNDRHIRRPLQLRDPDAREFSSIPDFAAFTYTGA